MNTVELQVVECEPSEEDFRQYPAFVIGRTLELGIGRVEADSALRHDGHVDFVFTSFDTGKSQLLGSLKEGYFRPVLARFGPYCGAPDMLYGGYTLFACEHEHEGQQRPHRFSLFVSNVRVAGFWLRLSLYQIDGVWPVSEMLQS